MAKQQDNTALWLLAGLAAIIVLAPTPAAATIGRPSNIQVFKRIRIYAEPGKPNLAFTQGKPGCYIIYENGKRVYVGHSVYNLYKTITRHFQTWTVKTSSQPVTYVPGPRKKYHVTIILSTSKQAPRLEYQLIQKYLPRDNTMKYPELWPTAYDDSIAESYNEAAKDLDEVPF
jgi:hypothetical protein